MMAAKNTKMQEVFPFFIFYFLALSDCHGAGGFTFSATEIFSAISPACNELWEDLSYLFWDFMSAWGKGLDHIHFLPRHDDLQVKSIWKARIQLELRVLWSQSWLRAGALHILIA